MKSSTTAPMKAVSSEPSTPQNTMPRRPEQEPTDHGTDDADDDVPQETEAAAFHHQTREPAGHGTDEQLTRSARTRFIVGSPCGCADDPTLSRSPAPLCELPRRIRRP